MSQCVVRMRAGAPMGRFPVSLSASSLFHPHRRVMDGPIKIHPILSTAASPSLEIGNCEWIPASTLFTFESKVAKKRISVQAVDGGLESDCDHKKCKVWIIHRGWSGLEID